MNRTNRSGITDGGPIGRPQVRAAVASLSCHAPHGARDHGLDATGGSGSDISPPAPDLTDDKWDHGSTDGEIFDVIKNGVAPDFNMIPWKDKLKDPDVWNVVNYLRSIAKKK